jgi:hypothetical protein
MKIHHLSLFLSIAVIVAAPDPAALAQENKSPVLPPGWIATTPNGLIAEPESVRKLANAPTASGIPTARGAMDRTRILAT